MAMLATIQMPSRFLTAALPKLPQGKRLLETGMRFSKQKRTPEWISPVMTSTYRVKRKPTDTKPVAWDGAIPASGSTFYGSWTVWINFVERLIQDPVSRTRIECKGMRGDALKRGTVGNHFFWIRQSATVPQLVELESRYRSTAWLSLAAAFDNWA